MSFRWRIQELLDEREITAYRLAKMAGLEPSTVYKLLKKTDTELRYVDVDTLEKLTKALKLKAPWSLLRYEPD